MRVLILLAMLIASPALAFDKKVEIDKDQDACFGSNTESECVDNAEAFCTWVTKYETIEKNGQSIETPVSWCEMTLPWVHK